jgi:hypothetical protein
MRLATSIVGLILALRPAFADPPYRALFVKDATWKLSCVKVPSHLDGGHGTPLPDGDLKCDVAELRTVGGATLVHIECKPREATATGWYAMIDRGLYRLDQFPASPENDPPRPKRRWEDYDAPKGTFQASDVAVLRASRPLIQARPAAATWDEPPHPSGWRGGGATFSRGGAWCAETHGSNGGGGESRTLCVSELGLAGTELDKGGAVFTWRCG